MLGDRLLRPALVAYKKNNQKNGENDTKKKKK